MHNAPWAKTSTSTGQFSQIVRVSSAEHSRAMTTRSQPSAAISRAPPEVNRLIWVLAWRGRSGSVRRSRPNSPQSCTSTASTPRRPA